MNRRITWKSLWFLNFHAECRVKTLTVKVSRIVAFWLFIRINPAKRSPEFSRINFAENSWLCRIFCTCGKVKKKVGKSRSVHAPLAFQEFLEKPGKPGDNFPHFPGFALSAKKPWPSDSYLAILTPPWFRGFLEKPRNNIQCFLGFSRLKRLGAPADVSNSAVVWQPSKCSQRFMPLIGTKENLEFSSWLPFS